MPTRNPYPGTESSADFLTTTNFDKLPGGLIGYTKATSSVGLTFTTISAALISVTLTPVTASRNLYIQWKLPISGSANGNTTTEGYNLYLYKDGSQIDFDGMPYPTNAGVTTQAVGFSLDVAPTSSGSHTYDIRGARFGASSATYTVNCSPTNPAWLLIWDEGVTF